MKFVIADVATATAHGIKIIPTMRQSVDKTQVVLHEEYVKNIDEFDVLTRYEFDSPEFTELMNSEKWTHREDYVKPNEDYAKVKAMQILTAEIKANINTMILSNKEKNDVKEFYPKWEDYIGKNLNEIEFIVNYNDKLYEIIQPISPVLEHQTPDLVSANYGFISEHEGTEDNPIPYEHWMLIKKDKYYTQNGKLYIGILDAPNGYDADLEILSTLVKEVKDDE